MKGPCRCPGDKCPGRGMSMGEVLGGSIPEILEKMQEGHVAGDKKWAESVRRSGQKEWGQLLSCRSLAVTQLRWEVTQFREENAIIWLL